jgi:hypothetical protein
MARKEGLVLMPEAEVSLRLAFWLVTQGRAAGPVDVAIDGAQVQVGGRTHFDLASFMSEHGYVKVGGGSRWQGEWCQPAPPASIRIHSNPGRGDVVVRLTTGRLLRAECKKGPLARSKSSQEYRLLREALGQLVTVERIEIDDLLAVAVPHTPKFVELATRWRSAPLISRLGLLILTVNQSGQVDGFGQTLTV